MLRTLISGCLWGFLLAGQAQAAEGLSWSLDEQSVRYRIQTDIRTPQPIVMRATENTEFRTHQVQTILNTRCGAQATRGKKAWEIRCSIDDLSISAGVAAGSNQSADEILKEWTEDLRGAHVQFVMTRDGRVRSVDLDLGPLKNRRETERADVMEMILARSYTGLDFQLPKEGTDGGAGTWTVKHANTMGTPSNTGNLGAIRGQAHIEKQSTEQVQVQLNARGVRQTGPTIVGLNGVVYDMLLTDAVIFDTIQQIMVARTYVVRGVPTASSVHGDDFRYTQQGVVERIDGQDVVPVGASAAQPSTAWLIPLEGVEVPVLAEAD